MKFHLNIKNLGYWLMIIGGLYTLSYGWQKIPIDTQPIITQYLIYGFYLFLCVFFIKTVFFSGGFDG